MPRRSMCFSAADVEEAEAEGRPWVALRVFDWDLVSADDFLGQVRGEAYQVRVDARMQSRQASVCGMQPSAVPLLPPCALLPQAELLFRDIDPSQQAPGAATWLPLYGWKGGAKSGKKVDAGEIHVAGGPPACLHVPLCHVRFGVLPACNAAALLPALPTSAPLRTNSFFGHWLHGAPPCPVAAWFETRGDDSQQGELRGGRVVPC